MRRRDDVLILWEHCLRAAGLGESAVLTRMLRFEDNLFRVIASKSPNIDLDDFEGFCFC